MCIYLCAFIMIKAKRGHNFKKSREEFMEEFGRRTRKGNIIIIQYNLKNLKQC